MDRILDYGSRDRSSTLLESTIKSKIDMDEEIVKLFEQYYTLIEREQLDNKKEAVIAAASLVHATYLKQQLQISNNSFQTVHISEMYAVVNCLEQIKNSISNISSNSDFNRNMFTTINSSIYSLITALDNLNNKDK